MFNPSHLLVSRTRQTPVQLIACENGCKLLTGSEHQKGSEPAFEFRPRQGFFCQGISVVGFRLEPIAVGAIAELAAKPSEEVAEAN